MAVIPSKLSRIAVLASKVETTTGTIESVSATDAAMIVRNVQLQRTEETNDREIPAALGQLASVPGGDHGTLSFQTDLFGSGSGGSPIPDWATRLFPACNYTSGSGGFVYVRGEATNTFVFYQDGLKRTLYGARGTFKITAEDGKLAVIDWTFTGKYKGDQDDTILAPAFPTVIPPVVKGSTLSIASFTPRCSKVEIDVANQVIMRQDLTDATGYLAAAITDCKPTGTMDPESVAVATRDWSSIRNLATEEAFSFAIGSTAGNTITISSAKCQTRTNSRGDRNGLAINTVGLQFNGASPLSIAFT